MSGYYSSLADVPATQRAALKACVEAGGLRRSRVGYVRNDAHGFIVADAVFTSRAVFALAREELVAFADGETLVVPTDDGRALVGAN